SWLDPFFGSKKVLSTVWIGIFGVKKPF
ncbi:MAG: hypothetical protein JWM68_3855, partial [Verrucomicrobiales bacterium]|nr:hypothetical protein [Verrucomicrobiales bacterium]